MLPATRAFSVLLWIGTVRPCVIMSSVPRIIDKLANVATNEGKPRSVISNPFPSPSARPTARVATTMSGMGAPLFRRRAATIEENPITDPTDRSSPRMAMTIVMPIPTIAEIDARTITPWMFNGVKNRGLRIEKTTTTTISEATAAAESAAKICLPMRLMRSTRHTSEDLFLARLLRDQFGYDPTIAQNVDSTRQAEELRDFGGTYKDCDAARCEL